MTSARRNRTAANHAQVTLDSSSRVGRVERVPPSKVVHRRKMVGLAPLGPPYHYACSAPIPVRAARNCLNKSIVSQLEKPPLGIRDRRQVTLDSSSSLVVNYSGSSPAEAISLLQPTSTTAYDSQENPLSQTDAMGTISASTFDNLGRPVAASQGQAVNVASGGPATFANLPLAPGLARTYTLYAQSSTAPSGYSVTQNGAGVISWTTNVLATTPLGGAAGGWYELGVVTLAQGNTSTGFTVSYSDGGTVSQVAYLEQTSATVCDAAGNVLSQVDGLNNVTTFGYNNVEQQVSSSQGPDRGGQRGAGGKLQQPAADAGRGADLHTLRPGAVV